DLVRELGPGPQEPVAELVRLALELLDALLRAAQLVAQHLDLGVARPRLSRVAGLLGLGLLVLPPRGFGGGLSPRRRRLFPPGLVGRLLPPSARGLEVGVDDLFVVAVAALLRAAVSLGGLRRGRLHEGPQLLGEL